jgi:hypothetical protein
VLGLTLHRQCGHTPACCTCMHPHVHGHMGGIKRECLPPTCCWCLPLVLALGCGPAWWPHMLQGAPATHSGCIDVCGKGSVEHLATHGCCQAEPQRTPHACIVCREKKGLAAKLEQACKEQEQQAAAHKVEVEQLKLEQQQQVQQLQQQLAALGQQMVSG